jgi:hypothetical protein
MPQRDGGAVSEAVRRSGGQAVVSVGIALLVLSACPPDRLTAQSDSLRVVPIDTSHQVKPINAFWRSLLLPGWGQAVTGRQVTGAVFAAWEGVTIMMTVKARSEATYLQRMHLPNQRSKRQEVQDWAVLWAFNHLFSGAEAFVSAHLIDFPKDLKFQAVPGGIGVSLPIGRHR